MSNKTLLKGDWDFPERDLLVRASWFQKVHFAALLAVLPPKVAWWTLQYCLPGTDRPHSLGTQLFINSSRHVSHNSHINQIRLVLPVIPLRKFLANKLWSRFAKGLNNYNHMFEVDNASARWIHEVPDRKQEDPVVLFLHGGAYVLKMLPPQVYWLGRFCRKLSARRVSVLALDYAVAPEAAFPSQLEAALATYRELLKTSSKVIVLGDSAGGNLTAALNAYLKHQEPETPRPWGNILVSPWVDVDVRETGSFVENAKYDYITDAHMAEFALAFAGDPANLKNPLVNMVAGDRSYWQGVFGDRTVCVYGEREILRDGIEEFVHLAGITDVFMEPKGVHDILCTDDATPGTPYIIDTVNKWFRRGASL